MLHKALLNFFILLFLGLNLIAAPNTVKLSNFKPQRDDATKAFQAAIASGAAKIIIDNPGFALQLNSIRLRSNLELVFEDGVIVEAKKNAFKSTGSFLFVFIECSNVILRGKGKVIIRMHKKDYQNKKLYRRSEWRHLMGLKGCKNIQISNLSLYSSGGDGIYLGTTIKTPYCKDIILEDLMISDHHRQGISIISAENLIIRRCIIKNTFGTPPAAGIDFEPNHTPKGQRLINCLVEDCKIIGNEGAGVVLYTPYMETAPPQSITIRNCIIKGNQGPGVTIKSSWYRKGREKVPFPTGFYKFENCKIIGNDGAALVINDHLATVKLSFENCLLEVGKDPRSYPILLAATHMRSTPIGGITFKNVTIDKLPAKREIMPFKNWNSSSVADIKGDIYIKSSDGKRRFPLEKRIKKIQMRVSTCNKDSFKQATSNWRNFSCVDIEKNESKIKFPGIRSRAQFYYIISAKAGEKVKITARLENPQATCRVKLKLISATNKEIFAKELNSKYRIAKIEFIAPETGCYSLSGTSRGENMIISSNKPGGWWCNKSPLLIAGKHNQLFFAVPKGVKNFEVKVSGSLNDSFITATVHDNKGKVIASNKTIEQPCRFKIERSVDTCQIWSVDIKMKKAKCVARVSLGKSLGGLFSTSPNNALKLNR